MPISFLMKTRILQIKNLQGKSTRERFSHIEVLLALLMSLPKNAAKTKTPTTAIIVKIVSWIKTNSQNRITIHTTKTRTSKIKALLLIQTPQPTDAQQYAAHVTTLAQASSTHISFSTRALGSPLTLTKPDVPTKFSQHINNITIKY